MLTINEFQMVSDFIYRRTGIRFESKKNYFLAKRVNKRMEEVSLGSVAEYVRMLRFSDPDGAEFQKLVELLTINETYFFRDFPQLQAFAEHCLMELIEEKAARGEKRLRVWSAGCSTGEEPYTLAIILREMVEDFKDWKVEILASDIDCGALQAAEKCTYGSRSIRDVPREYLDRHFTRMPGGSYKISKEIKKMVEFEYINFASKEILRNKRGFDFIFCRNVLIYFDEFSRKQLVDQFYIALEKGGYIFLGSSESVGRINTAFKLRRVEGYLVYQKV